MADPLSRRCICEARDRQAGHSLPPREGRLCGRSAVSQKFTEPFPEDPRQRSSQARVRVARLGRERPAADVQRLAGDVARAGAGEEAHRVRDLLRGAAAAERALAARRAPARPLASPRTVSIRPGTTQLTVTPSAARSCASARVRPTSPAFAATTWGRPTAPVCAERPPMLTIAPPPRAGSSGTPSRRRRRRRGWWPVPRASARDRSCRATSSRTAALLTRMSMPPEARDDRRDHARDGGGIGDVGEDGERLAAGGLISATTASTLALRRRVHRDRQPHRRRARARSRVRCCAPRR